MVCDDVNTMITQTGTPNIFDVVYPNYTSDTTVIFTATITNEDTLTDVDTDTKIVDDVRVDPVIDSFSWNDDIHDDNTLYTLTITAHDPGSQDLTYGVVCDDANVTIAQTGTSHIWNITYPDYEIDTTVIFTMTVTNEDSLTDVDTDIKDVNDTEESGDTGVFCGGNTGIRTDIIDYVTISTTGDATYFGDLTEAKVSTGATSNGVHDRGIIGGGDTGSRVIEIDYINIQSFTNASNFGELTVARDQIADCSNGVNERGLFAAGRNSTGGRTDVIDYVTISTTGDATAFGDVSTTLIGMAGTSNGINDRGLFAGGKGWLSYYRRIDYVTISSTGNGYDFGDLTSTGQYAGGLSNGVNERGVFGNRYDGSTDNTVDYVTISTTGNASNFGDFLVPRDGTGACSNGIHERGIFGGGDNGGTSYNTIEYITINSTSNTTDFGDLTVIRRQPSGLSDG